MQDQKRILKLITNLELYHIDLYIKLISIIINFKIFKHITFVALCHVAKLTHVFFFKFHNGQNNIFELKHFKTLHMFFNRKHLDVLGIKEYSPRQFCYLLVR